MVLLGAAGPALRFARGGAIGPAAVVLLAAAAIGAVLQRWSPGRARRTALAGAAAATLGTLAAIAPAARSALVVTALATSVAALASGWRPDHHVAGPDPWVRLSSGLVLAAEVVWLRRAGAPTLVLLVIALGVVVLARHLPDQLAALDRRIATVASAVSRPLAALVVLVTALPTLYLPGAIANAWASIRPRPTGSNWRDRGTTREDVRRQQLEPFTSTAPRTRRRRSVLAILMVVAVVPPALVARDRVAQAPNPPGRIITFPDFAFPHEPWVAELYDAGFAVEFHPSLGWRSEDVDTRYLRERDGVRRSWQPAHPQRTIWFVGGSALWGLGQRDDHTIPSEVARLADAAGLPIEVVNLGVPGYSQWQETAAIGLRLSRGERPDLIVYYDGANDLTGMIYRAGQGMASLAEPPNRFHQQVEAGSGFAPEPRSGTVVTDAELVGAFTEEYGAGVDLATHTAGAYDVPVTFYFQPQYLSTTPSPVDRPLLEDDPELAGPEGRHERALIAAASRDLPDVVIDLGGALDDAGQVTWFDRVHTNEVGARLVARAMWSTLEERIRRLPPPG